MIATHIKIYIYSLACTYEMGGKYILSKGCDDKLWVSNIRKSIGFYHIFFGMKMLLFKYEKPTEN